MRLIHVANKYWSSHPDDRERVGRAIKSWSNLGDIVEGYSGFGGVTLGRDGRDIGSSRAVPFVRDVIGVGMAKIEDADRDVIVLTNSDTVICSGARRWLDWWFGLRFGDDDREPKFVEMNFGRNGLSSGYSHRRDILQAYRNVVPSVESCVGSFSYGVDLIAFTAGWWRDVTKDGGYPDLLMGWNGWDYVFKYQMIPIGCFIKDIGGKRGLDLPPGFADPVLINKERRPEWVGEDFIRISGPSGQNVGVQLVLHEIHGTPHWWTPAGRLDKARAWNEGLCLDWVDSLDELDQGRVRASWLTLKEYSRT